jgi:hypothetical protein
VPSIQNQATLNGSKAGKALSKACGLGLYQPNRIESSKHGPHPVPSTYCKQAQGKMELKFPLFFPFEHPHIKWKPHFSLPLVAGVLEALAPIFTPCKATISSCRLQFSRTDQQFLDKRNTKIFLTSSLFLFSVFCWQ